MKPLRAALGPPARAMFGTVRSARHLWLGLKIGTRARRARRIVAKGGGEILARILSAGTVVRQVLWYSVPGEQHWCPGCGGRAIRHLQALGYTRPLASSRRFGFVSGCSRCGLVFANPLPAPDDLEETYSPDGAWGRTRPDHEPPVSRARLEALFAPIAGEFNVLHPPAGASVLDVGCGLGGMLDSLAALGWTTAGIDPGTKEAFTRHRELPAVPETPEFDLAILHHVLEHVTDPAGILRSLAAAIRPGGYLLVSVPNLDTLPRHGDLSYCIRSGTHVLAYTRDCLVWLLAAAGFRAVASDGAEADGSSPRQVVLARREDGPAPRPRRPLAAARAALSAHAARRGARPPWLPVRTQAAVANLRRTGVLRPGGVA